LRGLRAGAPVTLAGVTLIPIERTRIRSETLPHGYWVEVTKEALAVVICDLAGPRALDVEARELPLDELVAEIPGLESVIARFR
jgi:hypothetical protein